MNNNELSVVRIEKGKGQQIVLLCLSILLVLWCLLLLISGELLPIIIGLLGASFFSIAVWFFIKSLTHKKGLVRLDEHGFYDYSSAIATNDTLIPWNEVKAINLKSFLGKCYVQVLLHHPEIAKEARTSMGNMFSKGNEKLGYEGILIDTKLAKGINTEELLQLMETFHHRYGMQTEVVQTPEQSMKTIENL